MPAFEAVARASSRWRSRDSDSDSDIRTSCEGPARTTRSVSGTERLLGTVQIAEIRPEEHRSGAEGQEKYQHANQRCVGGPLDVLGAGIDDGVDEGQHD